jgi:endonuclease/exonuclease/phosphatase family metal-dependent hydrolase
MPCGVVARPRAFNTADWDAGEPILEAYHEVNALMAEAVYGVADKQRMTELLVELEVYRVNERGAVRRNRARTARWAWLRTNRGSFDREPADPDQDVVIVADGRDDWIGWVELATEPVNEIGTRMTARVIQDVGADVLGIVEADDRPSLVRFNHELLDEAYRHVMLVEGNDERGIDVAILTREGYAIEAIRSNVDTRDADGGPLFSRDCAQYQVRTPGGAILDVLVNHFKSQSGGGGPQRRAQSTEVRRIVDELVAEGRSVVVLGDLNEGPSAEGGTAANLAALFDPNGPLVDCYALPAFEVGERPGSFDRCRIRDRFDYLLLARDLVPAFRGGGVFRMGLWGQRATRPTAWPTYPGMTRRVEQASDHAAVYLDLDL